MRKIGLFFGSFNPIHVGHLIIAHEVLQNSDLDEVRLLFETNFFGPAELVQAALPLWRSQW
jgi:nicotinic acid mononucleotide adenylyltransferase